MILTENVRPVSEEGLEIGLDRWAQFQKEQGKGDEAVKKHIARLGKEYFPITVEEHLELLRKTGFKIVEIFWYSVMQAGFYAIKK